MDALRDLDFCFRIFEYFKRCQELGFLCETFCFSNAGNQLKIFLKPSAHQKKKKKKKEQKHTGGQIGPGHYHFTTCVLSEKMSLLYVETSFCFFVMLSFSFIASFFHSIPQCVTTEKIQDNRKPRNYLYTEFYVYMHIRF